MDVHRRAHRFGGGSLTDWKSEFYHQLERVVPDRVPQITTVADVPDAARRSN